MTAPPDRLVPFWIVSWAQRFADGSWGPVSNGRATYASADGLAKTLRLNDDSHSDVQITGPFYVRLP